MTTDKTELEAIVKVYETVSAEVKELKVELTILFKDGVITVLKAFPSEVITREQTSLKRFL